MLSKKEKLAIKDTIRKWVETFIVGLNLCPFAKAPMQRNGVRFAVADGKNMRQFLEAFIEEVEHLEKHPSIETTLLIIPAFGNIEHLVAFMQLCEETLAINQLAKTFQIVSFHPNMRFSGMAPTSPENLIGIAPYPIVHILRVASVEALGASVKKDVQAANSLRLRGMSMEDVKRLWKKVL